MIYKIQSTIPTQFRIEDSITSPSGERIPVLSGRMSRSEVPSEKGYRYKKGFWTKIINDDEVQNKIANRDMLGCIEHPEDDSAYLATPYEDASHIVLRAWVKDDEPYAKIGILNTEHGNKIKALMDVGHRPGSSTRALGGYDSDSQGQFIPVEGFAFITWDIVNSPNFPDIKLDKVSDSMTSNALFREVMQMHQLMDSVDEHYNEQKLKQDFESAVLTLQKIKNYLKL